LVNGVITQTPGVVDLDALVAAAQGKTFGTPGTAYEYIGTTDNTAQPIGGSNLGTSVTFGDFSGTGIDGYSFGAWGQNSNQTGAAYVYNGTTAFITQGYTNASQQVYYAGSAGLGTVGTDGKAAFAAGVDHIITGTGNNDWVHGIGTDNNNPGSSTYNPVYGHDSVVGGKGDDFIGIAGTTFSSVNGGAGFNTLVFEGSNMNVNMTSMSTQVLSITQFDLSNLLNNASTDPGAPDPKTGLPNGTQHYVGETHGNTLTLTLNDVVGLVSEMKGVSSQNLVTSGSTSANHITILGDASATVDLDKGSGWAIAGTETMNVWNGYTAINGVVFSVWHPVSLGTTDTSADLLIEQGVKVQMV
jgi:hypothetical protein